MHCVKLSNALLLSPISRYKSPMQYRAFASQKRRPFSRKNRRDLKNPCSALSKLPMLLRRFASMNIAFATPTSSPMASKIDLDWSIVCSPASCSATKQQVSPSKNRLCASPFESWSCWASRRSSMVTCVSRLGSSPDISCSPITMSNSSFSFESGPLWSNSLSFASKFRSASDKVLTSVRLIRYS